MSFSLKIRYLTMISIGLSLFIAGNMHQMKTSYTQINIQTGVLPLALQKIIAGPFLGCAADYNVLQIFTLYNRANSINNHTRKDQLWKYIYNRLSTASKQDPYFKDIYRITSGLLAFQPGYEKDAIEILSHGGQARTWDWESLFIAGFLAHELLEDNELATHLLQQSANRPNAPTITAGVTARIILQERGSKASVRFLEQMKASFPAEYQQELDRRIERMKSRGIE